MGAFKRHVTLFFKFTHHFILYTRYLIVARALGLAFRPSARASKGILHTTLHIALHIALINWSFTYDELMRAMVYEGVSGVSVIREGDQCGTWVLPHAVGPAATLYSFDTT